VSCVAAGAMAALVGPFGGFPLLFALLLEFPRLGSCSRLTLASASNCSDSARLVPGKKVLRRKSVTIRARRSETLIIQGFSPRRLCPSGFASSHPSAILLEGRGPWAVQGFEHRTSANRFEFGCVRRKYRFASSSPSYDHQPLCDELTVHAGMVSGVFVAKADVGCLVARSVAALAHTHAQGDHSIMCRFVPDPVDPAALMWDLVASGGRRIARIPLRGRMKGVIRASTSDAPFCHVGKNASSNLLALSLQVAGRWLPSGAGAGGSRLSFECVSVPDESSTGRRLELHFGRVTSRGATWLCTGLQNVIGSITGTWSHEACAELGCQTWGWRESWMHSQAAHEPRAPHRCALHFDPLSPRRLRFDVVDPSGTLLRSLVFEGSANGSLEPPSNRFPCLGGRPNAFGSALRERGPWVPIVALADNRLTELGGMIFKCARYPKTSVWTLRFGVNKRMHLYWDWFCSELELDAGEMSGDFRHRPPRTNRFVGQALWLHESVPNSTKHEDIRCSFVRDASEPDVILWRVGAPGKQPLFSIRLRSSGAGMISNGDVLARNLATSAEHAASSSGLLGEAQGDEDAVLTAAAGALALEGGRAGGAAAEAAAWPPNAPPAPPWRTFRSPLAAEQLVEGTDSSMSMSVANAPEFWNLDDAKLEDILLTGFPEGAPNNRMLDSVTPYAV